MYRSKRKSSTNLLSSLFVVTLLCAPGSMALAQDDQPSDDAQLGPTESVLVVRTGSPRQTLQSWLDHTLRAELLTERAIQEQTRANISQVTANTRRLLAHLDLSQTPMAVRNEIGLRATYAIQDILLRVALPPMDNVPDWPPYDEEGPNKWRLPGTPIIFAQIEEGPRAGEFLISATTIADAPIFLNRISHLPVQRPSLFESWSDAAPQLTGPSIPAAFVEWLPDYVKETVYGTPIWKIVYSLVALVIALTLFVFLRRWMIRNTPHSPFATTVLRMLIQITGIALAWGLNWYLRMELIISGQFARILGYVISAAIYLALARLVWLAMLAVFEWIIRSPKIPDQSLNANLLRLCGRLLGFFSFVLVLALGAQSLGMPLFGVMAGLGFGGLAIALAIRPTLENLLGGLALFADKPVRVGDFCSFGERMGFVEEIGIRSTKIRALDRSLISVPNAHFVDMQLVNFARCDMRLILTEIGLRYETEPDQLRLVLAKIREMLYAHPMIDRNTVRVRFVGYGSHSLDVQIRAYTLTSDWNEFLAIREDVFLRLNKIVVESGTRFAIPSRTLYLGRDGGLDPQLSQAAKEEVAGWRSDGSLPFPGPSVERIDELEGTLDYPPHGSVDAARPFDGSANDRRPR